MLSRRFLLKSAAMAACSAAAHPLMSTITFASVPGDNRLVVVVLRGAMDGLDVVQPYGDPGLRALRRSLSLGPDQGAIDLDGFYALHPALSPLLPLWQAGELGFAHAVATPYRDKRSHFDGQDVLEAGTGNDVPVDVRRGGWLNRLLQAMPGVQAETAYSVGSEQMLVLSGRARALSWAPDARLALSAQAQLLLDAVYHDDPLFREAAADAAEIGLDLGSDGRSRGQAGVRLARFAADRLNGETRIAAFSLSGWDTHARQGAVLGRTLGGLAETILALKEGLGPNWARTTVLALTEFGRTARENGSAGTDHGTGGAMLIAGGAVRGGRVHADWPGLADDALYQQRDLMPTRDVRAYAGWAMRGLFGTAPGLIEDTIFPGLDLGPDPRILR